MIFCLQGSLSSTCSYKSGRICISQKVDKMFFCILKLHYALVEPSFRAVKDNKMKKKRKGGVLDPNVE